MCASGRAASWPEIWACRALIWADSAVGVAVKGGGDACLGGAVPAGGAGRRGVQPGVQHAGRGRAPAHRDGRQPRADRLLIQPGGRVLAAEPGQERQADRAVQVVEQRGPGRERDGQAGAQLVAGRHPVRHQVPAGPHRHPQRDGRGRVGDQRPQPGPVRAQRVRQHERIEPVVLGAGGAEPRPQVPHLPGGDHHHRQARAQQGIDQRAVAPLDGDLGEVAPAQPGDQRGDPGLVTRGGEPVRDPAGQAGHARGVIGGGPVDPGAHAARRDIGQNQGQGILHHSLLAASPAGRHPCPRTRDARRQLTVRRSRRMALSAIRASR